VFESGLRKFDGLKAGHPLLDPAKPGQHECAACKKQFRVGDETTLVTLGPGDDPEQQERARAGRPYDAVAVVVHWSCATGIVR
jgi:hypothetical protein